MFALLQAGQAAGGVAARPSLTPVQAPLAQPTPLPSAVPVPAAACRAGSTAPASRPAPAPTPHTPAAVRTRAPTPAPDHQPGKTGHPKARQSPSHRLQRPPAAAPRSASFDRKQLEVRTSGNISEILARPRAWTITAPMRMPGPALLLADRVTGIDAEPCSMGTGTVHRTGVMGRRLVPPPGPHARRRDGRERQAIFLISYLGIDLLNQGDRVYRLLGCGFTHGDLPHGRDPLLRHPRGRTRPRDIRLMFSTTTAWSTAAPPHRASGQAGFTDKGPRLAGCLWTPEDQEIVANPRLPTPGGLHQDRL